MTCRELQPYLDDYLANRLDNNFRAELEEHLKSCDRCREELEQLKILTDILNMEKVPNPGEKYWDNIETHILSKTADKSNTVINEISVRPAISFFKYAISLAAVFLIFAMTVTISGPGSGIILGTRTADNQADETIVYLAESPIAGDITGSNLLGSIMLSSPGSFGQQAIILGRISNTAYGKDNNDSRSN